MVELSVVLKQLSKAGYRNRIWQRAEVKELCNVLHEDEIILQATNGHYNGGFSLLVATDHRLILVDRKIMFLTLDSISYSMIQEISYNYRLLNSTLHIFTSNKSLDFSSWNHAQIRAILTYAQKAMKNKAVNKDPYLIDGKVDGDDKQRQNQPIYIPQYIQMPPQMIPNSIPIDRHETQPQYISNPYYINEPPKPTSFTPQNPSRVNDSLANLALSQKEIQPEPRLSTIRTPGLTQRQYFRRLY
jgi:hypothetical protein